MPHRKYARMRVAWNSLSTFCLTDLRVPLLAPGHGDYPLSPPRVETGSARPEGAERRSVHEPQPGRLLSGGPRSRREWGQQEVEVAAALLRTEPVDLEGDEEQEPNDARRWSGFASERACRVPRTRSRCSAVRLEQALSGPLSEPPDRLTG